MGLVLVGSACLGSFAATWAYQQMVASPDTTSTVTVERDTPNVITAIRDLAVLEAASYHIERIIDLRPKPETQRQLRVGCALSAMR